MQEPFLVLHEDLLEVSSRVSSQQHKGSWAYSVEACAGHMCGKFCSPDLL